jgi:CheY-like chemotaxis protein
MTSQICLCYHPTTTLFIDDNKNFLETLQFEFKNKLIGKFYHQSLKALQFLSDEYQANSFTQRCFIEPSNEQSDHLFSEVNLRQIHKQSGVKNRFAEVAVCVIDYTMPGMNGLELSRRIKVIHPNIRIVLLTGEADHELAVEAFNEGIINKFLKKNSSDLITKLYQTIQELAYKYFMSLSQAIIDTVNGASDRFKRLRDASFVDCFNQLCQAKQIVEYYLIDEQGSFLLINDRGTSYWLAVVDNSEIEGLYEHAAIEKAAEATLEVLRNKTKMPVFFTEDKLWTHPTEWKPYLYPIQRLNGLDTYYYAFIENSTNTNEWLLEQVVSYRTYLNQAS